MEIAPGSPRNESEMYLKHLVSFYTNQAWTRFTGLLSFSRRHDSNFLARITNFYNRTTRPRSWRRRPGLPLPLPSNSLESPLVLTEASRVSDVLEDILEHILSSLHNVQKSLQFWQCKAEGTNAQKAYFMVFERGPRAFINGTCELIRGCSLEGSPLQYLCHSAAAQISERITILTSLRHSLATFLAQVYMEVDKFGEALSKDPEKSLPPLLMSIDSLFAKLEVSMNHPREMCQGVSSISADASNSARLEFERLPEINQEGSQWKDCEIIDAINLIYQNLQKLDSFLFLLVAKYKKPRKLTLHWVRYTCGAVGLSVCSVWLLKHSSLAGSSDIDNWIREARDSTVGFWNDHVEQPV